MGEHGIVPLHPGDGPGLSSYTLGQKMGAEQVAISEAQMPSHSHVVNATNRAADKGGPGSKILAGSQTPPPNDDPLIYSLGTPNVQMNPAMIANSGGNAAHENRQPLLGINFIIALQGIFPSRS